MTDKLDEPERQKAATSIQLAAAMELFWGVDAWSPHDSGSKAVGIVDDVWDERERQLRKWGFQTRPDGTGRIIDALDLKDAREQYDNAVTHQTLTWRHILAEEFHEALAETDYEKLRKELIEVMAVAASWIQDLDLKQDRAGLQSWINRESQ